MTSVKMFLLLHVVVCYIVCCLVLFTTADIEVNKQVVIGDSIVLECGLDELIHDLSWEFCDQHLCHTIRKGQMIGDNEYGKNSRIKFVPEKYDLAISNVDIKDVGEYICFKTKVQNRSIINVIVLETSPVCTINITPEVKEGIVAENDFGLNQETFSMSCSLKYHGSRASNLTWKETDDAGTTLNVDGRLSNTLSMKATWTRSNYACYVVSTQYYCDVVIPAKIIYAFNTSVHKSVSWPRMISCSANTSQVCSYKWYFEDGELLQLGSDLELTLKSKPGSYRCLAEFSIRGKPYMLEPFHLNYRKPDELEMIASDSDLLQYLVTCVAVLSSFILFGCIQKLKIFQFFRKCKKRFYLQYLHNNKEYCVEEIIERYGDSLEIYIDCNYRLIWLLFERRMINNRMEEKLFNLKLQYEKNIELLQFLKKLSLEEFLVFCQILKENDQKHVAFFLSVKLFSTFPKLLDSFDDHKKTELKKDISDYNGGNQPLDIDSIERIKSLKSQLLLEKMSFTEETYAVCESENIFSETDLENIKQKKTESVFNYIGTIIDALVRRSLANYYEFLTQLEKAKQSKALKCFKNGMIVPVVVKISNPNLEKQVVEEIHSILENGSDLGLQASPSCQLLKTVDVGLIDVITGSVIVQLYIDSVTAAEYLLKCSESDELKKCIGDIIAQAMKGKICLHFSTEDVQICQDEKRKLMNYIQNHEAVKDFVGDGFVGVNNNQLTITNPDLLLDTNKSNSHRSRAKRKQKLRSSNLYFRTSKASKQRVIKCQRRSKLAMSSGSYTTGEVEFDDEPKGSTSLESDFTDETKTTKTIISAQYLEFPDSIRKEADGANSLDDLNLIGDGSGLASFDFESTSGDEEQIINELSVVNVLSEEENGANKEFQHDSRIARALAEADIQNPFESIDDEFIMGHFPESKIDVAYEDRMMDLTIPPTSSVIPCEISKINFIVHRDGMKIDIEETLQGYNCHISWPVEEGDAIELKYIPPDGRSRQPEDWDSRPRSYIQMILDNIKLDKHDVPPEIWHDFRKEVGKISLDIDVTYDLDNYTIGCIGINSVTMEFVKSLKEIESDLMEHQKEVKEIGKNLKPYISMLIETSHLIDELAEIFEVKIVSKNSEISFSGPAKDVWNSKLFLYQKLNSVIEEVVDVSVTQHKMLARDDTKAHITGLLHQKKIAASFSVEKKEIVVYAFTQMDLQLGCELLSTELVEASIDLSVSEMTLLDSPHWKSFVKDLIHEYKMVEILPDFDRKSLNVTCLRNVKQQVQSRLNGFITEYALLERIIPMELGCVEVINKYMVKSILKIKSHIKDIGGQIEPIWDIEHSGFLVTASKAKVDIVCSELEELTNQVKAHGHEINQVGIPEYFCTEQGKSLLAIVEQKNHVSIQVDKSEIRGKVKESQRKLEFEVKFQVELDRGINIILIPGDITLFSGDAIVNDANKELEHNSGIARAIAEAGGKEIQEECLLYIESKGCLCPGNVFISKPGKLHCQAIIHAVGPMLSDRSDNEDRILSEAVRNALVEASNRGYRSIAIPAIGCAIRSRKYSIEDKTSVIFETIHSYLDGDITTRLQKVYLIDTNVTALDFFEKKMRTIQKSLRRSEERHEIKHISSCRNFNLGLDENIDNPSPLPFCYSSPALSTSFLETRTFPSHSPSSSLLSSVSLSTSCFTLIARNKVRTEEDITVHLIDGSIVDLKVDAIVNTTGKELDLNYGYVSKMILDKAGPEIQAECTALKPAGFSYGDIVITGGFKLHCHFVIHGSCKSWDNDPDQCEHLLRKFLKNIFEQGSKRNLKTVAIPAIGTGRKKIPHNIIANIMYDEVGIFSKKCPHTTLKNIYFVVVDEPSVQAFESKIEQLTYCESPTASSTPIRSAANPGSNFSPTGKVLEFGMTKVEVVQGDITKAYADAIINSTNEQMNLYNGAVSTAILKEGGVQLEREMQTAKMGPNKLCITKGGNLPAKHIIHLVAAHNTADWKTVIKNCLVEAERLKFGHVVFPLLGTGNIKRKPGAMAVTMVDAFDDFCAQRRPRYLNTITICIYQQQMVSEFWSAVVNRYHSIHLDEGSFSDTSFGREAAVGNSNKKGIGQTTPDENTGAGSGAFQNPFESLQSLSTFQNPPAMQESEILDPIFDSRIVLDIYGLSEESIESAIDQIKKIIENYIMDYVMNDPNVEKAIAKLDSHQYSTITNLRKECRVDIDIKENQIRIRGPPENIVTAVDKIKTMFLEFLQRDSDKRQVNWFYKEDNIFKEYPPDINTVIENAYRSRKTFVQWYETGIQYQVKFDTMTEEYLNMRGEKTQVKRITSRC